MSTIRGEGPPFAFTPSHTLVLYTNHLPLVGAMDAGIWRRLIVIPFNATIEGDTDVKNYADHLYEHAGGAILSWIMEGARLIHTEGYKLKAPPQVVQALQAYKPIRKTTTGSRSSLKTHATSRMA